MVKQTNLSRSKDNILDNSQQISRKRATQIQKLQLETQNFLKRPVPKVQDLNKNLGKAYTKKDFKDKQKWAYLFPDKKQPNHQNQSSSLENDEEYSVSQQNIKPDKEQKPATGQKRKRGRPPKKPKIDNSDDSAPEQKKKDKVTKINDNSESDSDEYNIKKKQKKKGEDKRKPIKKRGMKSLTQMIKQSTVRMDSSDEESSIRVHVEGQKRKRGRPKKNPENLKLNVIKPKSSDQNQQQSSKINSPKLKNHKDSLTEKDYEKSSQISSEIQNSQSPSGQEDYPDSGANKISQNKSIVNESRNEDKSSEPPQKQLKVKPNLNELENSQSNVHDQQNIKQQQSQDQQNQASKQDFNSKILQPNSQNQSQNQGQPKIQLEQPEKQDTLKKASDEIRKISLLQGKSVQLQTLNIKKRRGRPPKNPEDAKRKMTLDFSSSENPNADAQNRAIPKQKGSQSIQKQKKIIQQKKLDQFSKKTSLKPKIIEQNQNPLDIFNNEAENRSLSGNATPKKKGRPKKSQLQEDESSSQLIGMKEMQKAHKKPKEQKKSQNHVSKEKQKSSHNPQKIVSQSQRQEDPNKMIKVQTPKIESGQKQKNQPNSQKNYCPSLKSTQYGSEIHSKEKSGLLIYNYVTDTIINPKIQRRLAIDRKVIVENFIIFRPHQTVKTMDYHFNQSSILEDEMKLMLLQRKQEAIKREKSLSVKYAQSQKKQLIQEQSISFQDPQIDKINKEIEIKKKLLKAKLKLRKIGFQQKIPVALTSAVTVDAKPENKKYTKRKNQEENDESQSAKKSDLGKKSKINTNKKRKVNNQENSDEQISQLNQERELSEGQIEQMLPKKRGRKKGSKNKKTHKKILDEKSLDSADQQEIMRDSPGNDNRHEEDSDEKDNKINQEISDQNPKKSSGRILSQGEQQSEDQAQNQDEQGEQGHKDKSDSQVQGQKNNQSMSMDVSSSKKPQKKNINQLDQSQELSNAKTRKRSSTNKHKASLSPRKELKPSRQKQTYPQNTQSLNQQSSEWGHKPQRSQKVYKKRGRKPKNYYENLKKNAQNGSTKQIEKVTQLNGEMEISQNQKDEKKPEQHRKIFKVRREVSEEQEN